MTAMRTSARTTRRRAEEALTGFGLEGPVSIEGLKRKLEAARGRRIIIETAQSEYFAETACGVWWECDSFDVVFVPRDASPWLREHTIFHEFSHMIFRHQGLAACENSDAGLRSFVARTMPDLDPDMVTGSLHQRTDYTGQDEREAEMLASLLTLRRAEPHDVPLSNPEAETLRRALGGA